MAKRRVTIQKRKWDTHANAQKIVRNRGKTSYMKAGSWPHLTRKVKRIW